MGKASSDKSGLEAVPGKTRRTEACPDKAGMFSGRRKTGRPTEVTVRSLVAWIAECRETESLKPIDKAISRMVSESLGRNESERRFGLERWKPQKPSPLP
jgi:hypothetical protein